jgi:hypothetical protein
MEKKKNILNRSKIMKKIVFGFSCRINRKNITDLTWYFICQCAVHVYIKCTTWARNPLKNTILHVIIIEQRKMSEISNLNLTCILFIYSYTSSF